jgi:hypothetical protein
MGSDDSESTVSPPRPAGRSERSAPEQGPAEIVPFASPVPRLRVVGSQGPLAVKRPNVREIDSAPEIAQEAAIGIAEAALARVSAKVRERPPSAVAPTEPRPKAVEIPPDAQFNGELLRQVRKSRGITIAQLADRTRIGQRHLENVEADRYDALPATVYLRGILMNIARELSLDPLRVSKSYLELVHSHKQGI